MIRFRIPWPPSVNHMYGVRGSRRYVKRRGKDFRDSVALIVSGIPGLPYHGALAVTLQLVPPDRRRRDIDNIIKPTLDALEYGGAYINDHQIRMLSVYFTGDISRPGWIDVELEGLEVESPLVST